MTRAEMIAAVERADREMRARYDLWRAGLISLDRYVELSAEGHAAWRRLWADVEGDWRVRS